MKKSIAYLSFSLLLLSSLLLSSCKNKTGRPTEQEPTADTRIEWQETLWDFGEIKEGETVTHTFHFKNTGTENLLIKRIETGCGCTTTEYDPKPVPPGEKGKIEIAFNSEGRYGRQYKEIRIFANILGEEVSLHFSANVKP